MVIHNKYNVGVYRGDQNGVVQSLLLDHEQIISELGITGVYKL